MPYTEDRPPSFTIEIQIERQSGTRLGTLNPSFPGQVAFGPPTAGCLVDLSIWFKVDQTQRGYKSALSHLFT